MFSLKTCFRGSKIQKSGETTKRRDRLAPMLVHVCGLIWEWTYVGKHVAPRYLRWAFGISRCQQYKSLGNLPNGWTNWHQICYMSANLSGNGHRLIIISPSRSQTAFSGVGSNIKMVGKMAKRLNRLGPNCATYIQMAL